MRRAQSVRHYTRPSAAVGSDDLGVLREADEPVEDTLRKQLIDQDRENDKLRGQIQQLQLQLAQRPPLEEIQILEKEYKNLELILQGTQRENERCMAELERSKAREKMLERELSKLAGENWQSSLDIPPSSTLTSSTRSSFLHHSRSNTLASLSLPIAMSSSPQLVGNFGQPAPTPAAPLSESPISATGSETQHTAQPQDSKHQRRASMQSISEEQHQLAAQQHQATLSHLEQVRLLILGMEQRLSMREDKLAKSVEKAEGEAKKYEALRKEVASAGAVPVL